MSRRKTRGMTNTREYWAWASMKRRVLNPNHFDFPEYGGRGITIEPRWEQFEKFLEDLGFAPPGTQLGREDPNGPSNSQNARWMSAKESANRRRPRRWFRKPPRPWPLNLTPNENQASPPARG